MKFKIPYEKSSRRIIEFKTFCEGCNTDIYRNPIKDMNFCKNCMRKYYLNYLKENK